MSSFLDKIYENSPAFFQNLMVSGYGYKVYRREYGSKLRKALRDFEERQWWPEDKLREYQNEKLRALIRHAYVNVPHYKKIMDDAGIGQDDIKDQNDLHRIPVLTREDIKANFNDLIAVNYKRSSLIEGHTSGTTGSPLQFLWDKHICLIKNVVDWRQKLAASIKPGDKFAMFVGRVVVPVARTHPPFWRINRVLNHLYFSCFHMSKENLKTYLVKLKKFAPLAVEGYPSTVNVMARYLLDSGTTVKAKAVFTTSEALLPRYRENIERAFGCKVLDSYGMAERTIFATECDHHQGNHLNLDYGITEILDKDGNACPPGQPGRLVTTGLHNFSMPLIRYVTSDVSALKDSKCSCGREFPLLEDITTRAEDYIITPEGKYISPIVLQHPFKPMHSVVESQIVQEDISNLTIKIVKTPGYSGQDTEYLQKELHKRIGDKIKINIEFVESIPRTKAGKLKWVISHVSTGI